MNKGISTSKRIKDSANKITSLKVKDEKPQEQPQEIIIPPEKRQQILNDLRLFPLV